MISVGEETGFRFGSVSGELVAPGTPGNPAFKHNDRLLQVLRRNSGWPRPRRVAPAGGHRRFHRSLANIYSGFADGFGRAGRRPNFAADFPTAETARGMALIEAVVRSSEASGNGLNRV